MPPRSAVNDCPDVALEDPEGAPERGLRLALRVARANRDDLALGELRRSRCFPAGHTPRERSPNGAASSREHVGCVLPLVTFAKMGGVAARGVVARVQSVLLQWAAEVKR